MKDAHSGPLKIAGYVRVSTDKQDISPEVQRAALEREALLKGYELTLVEELAVSAATVTKRPLMQQLLAALKDGSFDGLMVAKLDRLSRSMEDGTRILADSQRQGWRIICLDLGVDTATVMGAGLFNMALNFAEIERKLIGKRTSEAMQQKAADGEHMGRVSVLPHAVMLCIHDLHREGLSLRQIVELLEAEQVPTARGGRWHASTVRSVLSSVTLQRLLNDALTAPREAIEA
ncbi:recombinase family protein [Glutamicibacter arilaitensis]|uniref:recombinase family protein n=1 Tax=Glutamicibacter arilaitensis TaxID=256701 RepID=UPI003FD4096B